MYKKSLSGLSCVLFLSFSAISGCYNSPPGSSQQKSLAIVSIPGQQVFDIVKGTTSASSTNNQNGSSGNNSSSNSANSNQNGNLSDQASDSNPIAAATPSNSPSSGASGSPRPTSSPSAAFSGPSGQLNVIINPNPPNPAPLRHATKF